MADQSVNHTGHYTRVYLRMVTDFVLSAIEQGNIAVVKTLDDVRKLPKWGAIANYLPR